MTLFNNNYKGRKSNHSAKEKLADLKDQVDGKEHIRENMCYPSPALVNSDQIKFMKNMDEKTVRIRLFLIEGERNFEVMSLREKCTIVAAKGDTKFQEWFVETGTNEKLANNWENFKTQVIEYCTNEDLKDLKKYKDETWSDFVKRMKQHALLKQISETEVIQHLQSIPAPRDFQVLFYTVNMNLDGIIKLLKDWETLNKNKREFREQKIMKKQKQKDIRCFNCNEIGHIVPKCPKEKKKVKSEQYNMTIDGSREIESDSKNEIK